MPGRRGAAILPLVVLALAGCAADAPEPTAAQEGPPMPDACLGAPGQAVSTAPCPDANATAPPPLPVTLELAGCLQLHTSFPYPMAVFTQIGFTLPDGFTFASSNGQTVDAFLAWWFCPAGQLNNSVNAPFEDVGSMFAALPVVPPASLTAADAHPVPVQLDLVPLTWVLNSQLSADHLAKIDGLRGGYVEHGDVEHTGTTNVPAVLGHQAFATASFGTFSVETAGQAQGGESPASRYRMWLAEEGLAVGYLDIVNAAGPTVGSGAALLGFQGDPEAGAPPVTAGTSHTVDATGVTVAHVALAAQP